MKTLYAIAVLLVLAACSERAATTAPPAAAVPPSTVEAPASAAPSASAAAPATADVWAGQWNGPEGTFLQVSDDAGPLKLTVKNLDGPSTFDAARRGDTIVFTRNGVEESLRATSGDATGMKWLAGKANCLTVKPGEGYCKD